MPGWNREDRNCIQWLLISRQCAMTCPRQQASAATTFATTCKQQSMHTRRHYGHCRWFTLIASAVAVAAPLAAAAQGYYISNNPTARLTPLAEGVVAVVDCAAGEMLYRGVALVWLGAWMEVRGWGSGGATA